MLLGGGRSALGSFNDENAIDRTMRSAKSSSLSSMSRTVFDENSASAKKRSGKSVRMALAPSSLPSSNAPMATKTPAGDKSNSRRRKALGDISNRKPGRVGGGGGGGGGSGGGGSKSGGGNVSLKLTKSRSVSFQTPGKKGGTKSGGMGKTPFGSARKKRSTSSGLTPRQSSSLAMATVSARKAEFALPKRQVSFTGNPPPPPELIQHRLKSAVREKMPSAPVAEAEPVEDIDLPAGGRIWDSRDYFDDDLSHCSAEELCFPYKNIVAIKEQAREATLRKTDRRWAEEEEELAREVERGVKKDYDEFMERMEDIVDSMDIYDDLRDDPQLNGELNDDLPSLLRPLDGDISI